MEYFSIKECAKLQHIQNPDVVKMARSVYVLADELINIYGNELLNPLPRQTVTDLCTYQPEVQNAMMFQALTMAMESFLGGAVRQKKPEQEQEFNKKLGQNMALRCTCFASWSYWKMEMWNKDTPELTHLQNQLDSEKRFWIEGESVQFNFKTGQFAPVDRDYKHERKKQERLEEKIAQLEKGQPIRMGEDEVFEYGINSCMQLFFEEGKNIVQKYKHFCALSYSERAKEFDKFMEKVFEVNGLSPRSIAHHNDTDRGNNQNQRG
jgi:hypothetical protein